MLKTLVESVESGAVLAKPIISDTGITLITAGVTVSVPIKEKLTSMGTTEIFIVGKRAPDIPKEEFIAKVNFSFSKTELDPRMAAMKRALLAHIEELY